MRTALSILACGAAVLVASPQVVAHHAFTAEFDANRPLTLSGTVTKMEWINPHAWIHMDVKKPDGAVESWMVEGGTPNTLMRRGFTKDSLKAGTSVVVFGFQSKDRSRRMNGHDVRLPDGRTLFLGSTGTGAPGDSGRPVDR